MPRFRTMIESWFKYEENINDESIGIHRDSGDCDRQEFRAGSGFFSAPRLQVESITYSETKVEIGSSYNNDYSSVIDPQKFECRLWIIKIHSRNPTFSILKNCRRRVYYNGWRTGHITRSKTSLEESEGPTNNVRTEYFIE
jgi:hypothetical protein